jgi:hypothetical protein
MVEDRSEFFDLEIGIFGADLKLTIVPTLRRRFSFVVIVLGCGDVLVGDD